MRVLTAVHWVFSVIHKSKLWLSENKFALEAQRAGRVQCFTGSRGGVHEHYHDEGKRGHSVTSVLFRQKKYDNRLLLQKA